MISELEECVCTLQGFPGGALEAFQVNDTHWMGERRLFSMKKSNS